MKSDNSLSEKAFNNRITEIIQTVASITIFLLGSFVLTGWFTHNRSLIQILPTFVPMQFNTALGFLLCGIALFLSIRRYKKAAILLSIIIFAIGGLTLAEYIFGTNFGIDQMFMRHYINIKTSHPGRMAPNTALCFVLSSIAIFVYKFDFKFPSIASVSIGAVITGLGFLSLFGYLYDIPTAYSWGRLTAMAVHTSLGFILTGTTIILLSWNDTKENQRGVSLKFPLLVVVSGLTVTAFLWQVIYYQERGNLERTTMIEADNLRNAFVSELRTRVLALERMADRWEVRKGTPREEWNKDATRYVNDYGSYQAIEWVDADFVVQWIVPSESSESVAGLDSVSEERRRVTLETARDSRHSLITSPVDLVQGGKGVLIYCPIYIDEKFNGFILGVLKVDSLFNSVLPKEFKENYSLKILNGNEEVFEDGIAKDDNPDPFGLKIKIEDNFESYGVKWKSVVSPRAEVSSFSDFSLDDLGLIIGILLTALLAGLVYLYQQSRLDSEAKTLANIDLINEVTARKKIEQVLRETSVFRQAILNSADYIIISTDTDGTITTFNKTAEKLLGYEAEKVVGKFSPADIHIENELLEYSKELLEKEGIEAESGFETYVAKAKKGIIDEREWSFVRQDETVFPVRLSVSALRNSDGKITGFLAIGKDISDLKEANENLLQSEERFKTFMNNSPTVAFIRDDRHRYTFINKTFEKRFRVKAENLLGKTDFEWLSEAAARESQRTNKKVINNGEIVKLTEKVIKKDGSEDYWLLVKFPIVNPGGKNYVGGMAIDVTESKNLEKELKEARDTALESVRTKSEFLANMSHEIRTPMNGVLGMTEIILETNLDDEQRDYALTIQSSADSLLRIINDILDFSKIEAGKIVFENIEFNLRSTVENIAAMFAEETHRKGLEIISLVEMNVPTGLIGDPGRLKQVLINLVGNAIKFTDEGSVYIKVGKVSETDTHTALQFDITDTGIGINPGSQKYLFQAFTQADGSMTRKYGGTGLGLAISQQLVEMMNGEISVKSEIGNGSTFTFTAHFEKQSTAVVVKIEPIRTLKNLRALIVDDNATNREIISHQIHSWEMVGSEADGADAAMKLLEQANALGKPFDLVFLDLMMPDVGGFELANMIRANKNLAHTKLILMPSFGKRGHAQDALKAGIDAYLVKPIRQADVFDCVATVMGKATDTNRKEKSVEKLITRHTLSEQRFTDEVRILLAEDNPVNRKVTENQIKFLGYKFETVSNGLEVLEALKRQRYSLILMDCQMPEMDGYEAAAEIRRNEAVGQHIPIIAITANALLGEKEKCFAAGMDDYLSKPFKKEELNKTIKRWATKAEIPQSVSVEASPVKSAIYDFLPQVSEKLYELKGEVGEEMVDMIVSLFVEDSFLRLKKMHTLMNAEDLQGITDEAHSLRGSALNIGAENVANLCAELEANAKNLSKPKLDKLFSEVEASFLELFEGIETLDLQFEETLAKA